MSLNCFVSVATFVGVIWSIQLETGWIKQCTFTPFSLLWN